MFLVLFKENILIAFTALTANKLRTLLSVLGITIGIFAIISVFTIVDSLELELKSSFKILGDDAIMVQKMPWIFDANTPWWKYLNRPPLTLTDAEELNRKSKAAIGAAFILHVRKTLKHKNNSVENADIVCASSTYNKVRVFEFDAGRFFTEAESEGGRAVALLGTSVAEGLFGNSQIALGQEIQVGGRKVLVVGILKKEGESLLGNTADNQVILPVKFATSIVDIDSKYVDPYILVKPKEGVSVGELMDDLMGNLRNIRKIKPMEEENFALNKTSLISKSIESVFGVVGTAGWIIGCFSVLVGGFGIANIMFVSVYERINLIGIQKALGAKRIYILIQFLLESVVLSLIGGILGLLLIIIALSTIAALDLDFGFEIILTIQNVILGLTVSVLIGIISGFIPSYSASQLDPVEAMRA